MIHQGLTSIDILKLETKTTSCKWVSLLPRAIWTTSTPLGKAFISLTMSSTTWLGIHFPFLVKYCLIGPCIYSCLRYGTWSNTAWMGSAFVPLTWSSTAYEWVVPSSFEFQESFRLIDVDVVVDFDPLLGMEKLEDRRANESAKVRPGRPLPRLLRRWSSGIPEIRRDFRETSAILETSWNRQCCRLQTASRGSDTGSWMPKEQHHFHQRRCYQLLASIWRDWWGFWNQRLWHIYFVHINIIWFIWHNQECYWLVSVLTQLPVVIYHNVEAIDHFGFGGEVFELQNGSGMKIDHFHIPIISKSDWYSRLSWIDSNKARYTTGQSRTVGQERKCKNYTQFRNVTDRPTRKGVESCVRD